MFGLCGIAARLSGELHQPRRFEKDEASTFLIMVNTIIQDHDAAFTDSEISSSFDDADRNARTVDHEEEELERWRQNARAIRIGAIKFLARADEHAMDAAMTVVDIYERGVSTMDYTRTAAKHRSTCESSSSTRATHGHE